MNPLRPAVPVIAASLLAAGLFCSCEDEVSPIGGSIASGEVAISVDSLILKINAETVVANNVDARSTTNLIGNLNIPEYGSLSAAYVTQLLSASAMAIPDSIGVDRVDSLKMALQMPRSMTIGDTLAPQQLKIYRLNRQLPSDILSNFNPAGFYDPADVVATRNYTLSAIALGDTAFRTQTVLNINFPLPKNWAVDVFNAYRNGSDVFEWPQEFNKVFPGLYIEQSFGRGAMANVQATQLLLYYHYYTSKNVVENDVAVTKRITVRDSVCLFASSPEVISSSIIDYKPSDEIRKLVAEGKKIITTPSGYRVRLTFPADEILKKYLASDHDLSVVNNLTFTLPATSIPNSHGIVPPPELLMIKTSEIDDFFANGKVPDNKTSFRGTYSSTKGRYEFTSMRDYIVSMLDKQGKIEPADVDFTLIPVKYTTETVSSSYDGSVTIYVTGCAPYLSAPCMTLIDTDRASIVFTFTSQYIK